MGLHRMVRTVMEIPCVGVIEIYYTLVFSHFFNVGNAHESEMAAKIVVY